MRTWFLAFRKTPERQPMEKWMAAKCPWCTLTFSHQEAPSSRSEEGSSDSWEKVLYRLCSHWTRYLSLDTREATEQRAAGSELCSCIHETTLNFHKLFFLGHTVPSYVIDCSKISLYRTCTFYTLRITACDVVGKMEWNYKWIMFIIPNE